MRGEAKKYASTQEYKAGSMYTQRGIHSALEVLLRSYGGLIPLRYATGTTYPSSGMISRKNRDDMLRPYNALRRWGQICNVYTHDRITFVMCIDEH